MGEGKGFLSVHVTVTHLLRAFVCLFRGREKEGAALDRSATDESESCRRCSLRYTCTRARTFYSTLDYSWQRSATVGVFLSHVLPVSLLGVWCISFFSMNMTWKCLCKRNRKRLKRHRIFQPRSNICERCLRQQQTKHTFNLVRKKNYLVSLQLECNFINVLIQSLGGYFGSTPSLSIAYTSGVWPPFSGSNFGCKIVYCTAEFPTLDSFTQTWLKGKKTNCTIQCIRITVLLLSSATLIPVSASCQRCVL